MIKKEIIDLIVNNTGIIQRELIEKDIILHRILMELSSHKYFLKNYAFKGGTCLLKCYLHYYRFSEDLDFTYINQKEFEGKSEKQIRKILSEKISLILELLENISMKMGLDFKAVKSDRKYIEFGGSNKQSTFKLWYTLEGSSKETFIKVQINFLEKMNYPIIKKKAENVFFGKFHNREAEFLLPEDSKWILKTPELKCYDLREILIEKVRAVLTRRGIKMRDYIDVYMIEKKEKLYVEDFKVQIKDKIKNAIKSEKYKTSMNTGMLESITFDSPKELAILLMDIPEDFNAFFTRFNSFCEQLVKEFQK